VGDKWYVAGVFSYRIVVIPTGLGILYPPLAKPLPVPTQSRFPVADARQFAGSSDSLAQMVMAHW